MYLHFGVQMYKIFISSSQVWKTLDLSLLLATEGETVVPKVTCMANAGEPAMYLYLYLYLFMNNSWTHPQKYIIILL